MLCIKVLGGSKRKYASVGDIIKVSIKEAIPNSKVKKGDKLNSIRGIVEYSYSEYKIAPLGDAGIDWKK